MSRDVSWGLYISQFTFLVGVAAGGLMLVLPYYIHNYKEFGTYYHPWRVPGDIGSGHVSDVHHGRSWSAAARSECHLLSHPAFHALLGYVCALGIPAAQLTVRLGYPHCRAQTGAAAQMDLYLCAISIPFAVSIHTVTAMLYCGLPGRHFLAVSDYCTALSGVSFCGWSVPDPDLPV